MTEDQRLESEGDRIAREHGAEQSSLARDIDAAIEKLQTAHENEMVIAQNDLSMMGDRAEQAERERDEARAYCVSREDEMHRDRLRVARLEEAAREMEKAESWYRIRHDCYGDGAIDTGRAWDRMRRAGEALRAALDAEPEGTSPSMNEIADALRDGTFVGKLEPQYAPARPELTDDEAREDAETLAMERKLHAKEIQGYSGWDDPGNQFMIAEISCEHAARAMRAVDQFEGVANLACMLWNFEKGGFLERDSEWWPTSDLVDVAAIRREEREAIAWAAQEAIGNWGGPERAAYDAALAVVLDAIRAREGGGS